MKCLTRSLIALIVLSGLLACVSTDDAPVKTHYTLESGATEKQALPMPSKTPIFVQWHYSDGHTESKLAFQGWDFDEDGRFEMVQVIGNGDLTEAYVFDFDGDGLVDHTQQVSGQSQPLKVVAPISSGESP